MGAPEMLTGISRPARVRRTVSSPATISPPEILRRISLTSFSFSAGNVVIFFPTTSSAGQPKIRSAAGFQAFTLPARSMPITAMGAACTSARKRSVPRRDAASCAVRTKATISSAAMRSTTAVAADASAVTILTAAEIQYTGFQIVTTSMKCVMPQLTMNTPKAQKKRWYGRSRPARRISQTRVAEMTT